MEIIMAFVIGFLLWRGLFNLIKSLLRIIIGTGLLSHGAHLLILTMGGLGGEAPPVLSEGAKAFADPLPQALILTAIVISFGVTAFFLVLAYRSYQELNTDDISLMRGSDEDE